MVSTTANIEAKPGGSSSPGSAFASATTRGLRRLATLTRAEAARALPTALLFAGVALLALVWIRLIADVRAPLGSVERETLLFGVLALIATPTMASMFDAGRERSLNQALRAAPVTALESAAARMLGALLAIVTCVASVAAIDGVVVLFAATPSESAYSVALSRHGFRAEIEPLALAAPIIAFAVASALQHALASAIVGAALATVLVIPQRVLPGAPTWLVFDLQSVAAHHSFALTGVVVSTLVAARVAPLRGPRSRSILRRALPVLAFTVAVLAARSPYGQRLVLPGPSWSAEDAETTFFPSPDGRVVFIQTYQEHAWPRRTLRRLDAETLEITRVPRPPVGVIGWLTRDIGVLDWNDAGTAVVVDDLAPMRDHAPPPLLALSPAGDWISLAGHAELVDVRTEGSRYGSWSLEASREARAYRFDAAGGHALKWREGMELVFARDAPHLLVSGVPGEELFAFDGRTGEMYGLGVRLPDQRGGVHVSVSPDLEWVYIGRPRSSLVHLETGWSVDLGSRLFAVTRRSTVAVLEDSGWVEASPDSRRALPFPPEAAVRHLFGDRWFVLGPDGASIRSTDGAVELDVPMPGRARIAGRPLLY